jgi:hypothetical protein
MVKLHVIRGEGGEPAKPEPGQPVAEIFLRTNLSTQQTDELRTALEQSGKGTFSFQNRGDRSTVLVTSVDDLNLVRSNFARAIDAWKELTADD